MPVVTQFISGRARTQGRARLATRSSPCVPHGSGQAVQSHVAEAAWLEQEEARFATFGATEGEKQEGFIPWGLLSGST